MRQSTTNQQQSRINKKELPVSVHSNRVHLALGCRNCNQSRIPKVWRTDYRKEQVREPAAKFWSLPRHSPISAQLRREQKKQNCPRSSSSASISLYLSFPLSRLPICVACLTLRSLLYINSFVLHLKPLDLYAIGSRLALAIAVIDPAYLSWETMERSQRNRALQRILCWSLVQVQDLNVVGRRKTNFADHPQVVLVWLLHKVSERYILLGPLITTIEHQTNEPQNTHWNRKPASPSPPHPTAPTASPPPPKTDTNLRFRPQVRFWPDLTWPKKYIIMTDYWLT